MIIFEDISRPADPIQRERERLEVRLFELQEALKGYGLQLKSAQKRIHDAEDEIQRIVGLLAGLGVKNG